MKNHNIRFNYLRRCIIVICLMMCTAFLFAIAVSAEESNDFVIAPSQAEKINCPHSVFYTFDEENKTVEGIYTNWRVEGLIFDVTTFSHDTVKIFDGNNEITEGYFKEGMRVQIYHNDSLYGKYTIKSLLIPSENAELNTSETSTYAESSFGLPVDNVKLTSKETDGGNITLFSTNYMKESYIAELTLRVEVRQVT